MLRSPFETPSQRDTITLLDTPIFTRMTPVQIRWSALNLGILELED